VDSGDQAAESVVHVILGVIPHAWGELLLGEPLSVSLGDMVVSGDPSFYAGEVGGPLAELFGCLLQRDAELPSEGPEVGDVRRCDRAEYRGRASGQSPGITTRPARAAPTSCWG
jgi:hypothetical protein